MHERIGDGYFRRSDTRIRGVLGDPIFRQFEPGRGAKKASREVSPDWRKTLGLLAVARKVCVALSRFAEALTFFVIPPTPDGIAMARPFPVVISFVPILHQLTFQPIVPG